MLSHVWFWQFDQKDDFDQPRKVFGQLLFVDIDGR